MSAALIQLKHRYSGAVLFEFQPTDEQQASGLAMRHALEAATRAKAYLGGAYLRGAYLRGAYLGGADLRGAYLGGADLGGADLRGADGSKLLLVGERPFFEVGPIGSRSDTLQLWLTEQGPRIRAGCFFGTRDEFAAKVSKMHGDNPHGVEYLSALALLDEHAALWGAA